MIDYIENKNYCSSRVEVFLQKSRMQNRWTNFGPGCLELEQSIKTLINLDQKWSVVMCANATVGLHALWALQSLELNREPIWAVSSFGFPSTILGPLSRNCIVDCNRRAMLDLNLIPDNVDAIVPTNVFGSVCDMSEYEEYCKQRNIPLIIDSAMSLDAAPIRSRAVISFHHTKPWGFGEGGCIVVEEHLSDMVRDILNFKDGVGMNGKMSDVAAAFISNRLADLSLYKPKYQNQYKRIANIATHAGFQVLGNNKGTPACVPILGRAITLEELDNNLLTLRKYYKPLSKHPIASDIFNQIINVPCNPDLSVVSDESLFNLLKDLS